MNMRLHSSLRTAALVTFWLAVAAPAWAQEGHEVDPAAALTSVLTAACRQNESQFAHYLTPENATAFHELPAAQRTALLRRLSLLDDRGRTLVSSDAENHTVLRCESPGATTEFRFGEARTHENLAFIPIGVVNGHATEFGLVRDGGGWRLLSLGLLLFNIPELEKQWAEQDLEAREGAAMKTLEALAGAIGTYRRAFGKLPESLAELGPAPKEGISPDAANLVNADLAAGSRAGYRYRYRIVPTGETSDAAFELAASPVEYSKTGRRSFFLDAQGKLRGADKQGAVADPNDPVIPSAPSVPNP